MTMLGRNGVDLRTAQELAGHSTPLLTARYSHRRLYDLAGAVDKLPNLVPTAGPTANAAEIPLRLTGTEGARSVTKSAAPGAVTGGIRGHSGASIGIVWQHSGCWGWRTCELATPGNDRGRCYFAPARVNRHRVTRKGFEPLRREPKSLVLPLHYRVFRLIRQHLRARTSPPVGRSHTPHARHPDLYSRHPVPSRALSGRPRREGDEPRAPETAPDRTAPVTRGPESPAPSASWRRG